ncbi:glycosyltransferase family 2 protein [Rhizorhabdus argentea]|uniref:glycosyltransferase family 2 protein n=1 Tax=Rhizorhabdus argentea TaxID=1387174 RepID=UPI0030ECDCF8
MIFAPILVLIVNYRTAALTVRAVGAILDEVRARGDTQILVVDNGSGDGSAGIIEAAIAPENTGLCSVLALDDNLGFAGGNNAGLEHYASSTGRSPEFVWLLNPDTIAAPDALATLVDFLGGRPGAGIAGGLCLRPDGTVRHSAFRFHSPLGEFAAALDFGPLRRLLWRHDVVVPAGDSACRVDWVSGAHFMIRGTLLDRIGSLDSRYFLYFEETDFCARAADAGFETWHVPASRVTHIGGQATGVTEAGEKLRRPRYWFASRARFLLRRHGLAATHFANLLWLLASPPGALLARLRGRPRHDPPRLWRDFLLHYYGPGGLMYRARDLAT